MPPRCNHHNGSSRGEPNRPDLQPPVPSPLPVRGRVRLLTVLHRVVDDQEINWPPGETAADADRVHTALVARKLPFVLGGQIVTHLQAEQRLMGGDVVADGATPAPGHTVLVGAHRDPGVGLLCEHPQREPAGRTLGLPLLGRHAQQQPTIRSVGESHEFGVNEVERRGLPSPRIQLESQFARCIPPAARRLEHAGGGLPSGQRHGHLSNNVTTAELRRPAHPLIVLVDGHRLDASRPPPHITERYETARRWRGTTSGTRALCSAVNDRSSRIRWITPTISAPCCSARRTCRSAIPAASASLATFAR